MQVQVELSEIESLKSKIERLEKERSELILKVRAFDPGEIQRKTEDLTKKMFDALCAHVFKRLGFDEKGLTWDTHSFHNFFIWANGEPILNKDVDAQMGAYITNSFREAFVSMNIKTL